MLPFIKTYTPHMLKLLPLLFLQLPSACCQFWHAVETTIRIRVRSYAKNGFLFKLFLDNEKVNLFIIMSSSVLTAHVQLLFNIYFIHFLLLTLSVIVKCFTVVSNHNIMIVVENQHKYVFGTISQVFPNHKSPLLWLLRILLLPPLHQCIPRPQSMLTEATLNHQAQQRAFHHLYLHLVRLQRQSMPSTIMNCWMLLHASISYRQAPSFCI